VKFIWTIKHEADKIDLKTKLLSQKQALEQVKKVKLNTKLLH
jgi:hypothetical protein